VDINATLFGQMITFGLFVWITMRFVWPPIHDVLADRRTQVAEGLAAAERGQREWVLVQHKALEHLKEAKAEAAQMIVSTQLQVERMLEEARKRANLETKRILEKATEDIAQMETELKIQLRQKVSMLAIAGAEKILSRSVDFAVYADCLRHLAEEL